MAKGSSELSRRDFMNHLGIGAASAAALAATGCASTGDSATASGDKSLTGPYLDLLNSNEDNMTAWARMQGNLDSSQTKYGWYKGMVSAVMPDQPVKDLFMMEGFSCARLIPKEDGLRDGILALFQISVVVHGQEIGQEAVPSHIPPTSSPWRCGKSSTAASLGDRSKRKSGVSHRVPGERDHFTGRRENPWYNALRQEPEDDPCCHSEPRTSSNAAAAPSRRRPPTHRSSKSTTARRHRREDAIPKPSGR